MQPLIKIPEEKFQKLLRAVSNPDVEFIDIKSEEGGPTIELKVTEDEVEAHRDTVIPTPETLEKFVEPLTDLVWISNKPVLMEEIDSGRVRLMEGQWLTIVNLITMQKVEVK